MTKNTTKKTSARRRKATRRAIKKVPGPVPQNVAIVAMGASKHTFIANACAQGGMHGMYDQVWAINNMGGVIQHDLLFHMDDCRIQEARAALDEAGNIANMVRWLKNHPGFITSRAYPDYPGAIEFPLKEVLERYKCPYLNNTVVYAFVYAMHIGVPKVTLFGCDYTYPNNAHMAEEGRACLEFWIGSAITRGMQVEIGEGSTLLDVYKPDHQMFYGYDTVDINMTRNEKTGDLSITMTERPVEKIPTAQEIEKRYSHDRSPQAT